MKQVIDWFEIPVSDMSRAQTFYEAVLQTTLLRENFGGPNMDMAVFKEEGLRAKGALMASNPALQVGGSGTLVYLHAGTSLDAALQRVEAAGGRVARQATNHQIGQAFPVSVVKDKKRHTRVSRHPVA
jgi:predicted enzyme related to lactoylglutathione lyase